MRYDVTSRRQLACEPLWPGLRPGWGEDTQTCKVMCREEDSGGYDPSKREEGRKGWLFITLSTGSFFELNANDRDVILGTVKFHHTHKYYLKACVVMPDHMHVLLKPLLKREMELFSVSEIVHNIKSYAASTIGKEVKLDNSMWAQHSRDVRIRDARHLETVMRYIRQNPVRAGLADCPEDYRWLHVR